MRNQNPVDNGTRNQDATNRADTDNTTGPNFSNVVTDDSFADALREAFQRFADSQAVEENIDGNNPCVIVNGDVTVNGNVAVDVSTGDASQPTDDTHQSGGGGGGGGGSQEDIDKIQPEVTVNDNGVALYNWGNGELEWRHPDGTVTRLTPDGQGGSTTVRTGPDEQYNYIERHTVGDDYVDVSRTTADPSTSYTAHLSGNSMTLDYSDGHHVEYSDGPNGTSSIVSTGPNPEDNYTATHSNGGGMLVNFADGSGFAQSPDFSLHLWGDQPEDNFNSDEYWQGTMTPERRAAYNAARDAENTVNTVTRLFDSAAGELRLEQIHRQ